MTPRLFYLVGAPGSGKRTVGEQLEQLTGAALLDNHLVYDPVFKAYGLSNNDPVPEQVWEYVRQMRAVVRATAAAAPLTVCSATWTNSRGAWSIPGAVRAWVRPPTPPMCAP